MRSRITFCISALIILGALFTIGSRTTCAAVPDSINYQGILKTAGGAPVADGNHNVTFKIYDAASGPNLALWTETKDVTTAGGLFTTLLGSVTALPSSVFSGPDRWLGIAVNPDPEMTPRTPVVAVAYAIKAKDADVATLAQDLNCVGCVSAGEIAAGAVVGGLGGPILDESITSIDLFTNSVGADEIAVGAVGASEIATGAVVGGLGGDIADGTITADDLATGSVGTDEIAVGAVVGGLAGPILDGSITSLDLGTNSVGSDEIGSAAVNSSEIATDAVGSAEIATDAVGADEIATDAVTALEIAVDAVGAAEIATGAVGSDAIASSAVGTAEVADGSLTAVDIDDEPGVASNTRSVGDLSLDGTVQTLLSRTITAPAAGYVLVMATAQVNIVHTTGTLSFANFGVTSTTGVFPDNQTVSVQLHVDVPSGTFRQAVTVHGLFSTPGGMDSFYFLGEEILGIISVGESQLTLIYFPTAHGTVVSTAAPLGNNAADR